MQVTQIGVKATLTVGTGAKSQTFDLYEAKANVKKTELQTVLFRLAESATDLETKLEQANKKLETMKQQKAPNLVGGLFDMDKKKKGQPKAQPKQAGMSTINPSSKKRKGDGGGNVSLALWQKQSS